MPFSVTIPDIPSAPAAQGKIANEDRTPAREYVTLFDALVNVLSRMSTALEETGSTVIAVGDLPAAADSQGQRYIVTDSLDTTFMTEVAPGGADIVPVFSDGTNWRIG